MKSCPELLRTSKHLLEMRFGANQLKLDPDLTFEIFQECEQPEIYNPSIRDQSAEGGIMDSGLASFAVSAQACRPLFPVKALALPELTTSARA